MDKSNGPVQHIYLRLKPEHHPVHTKGFKTHAVGVLAFQRVGGDTTRVAGSLVNKKDNFFKKVGVTKALGRLQSENSSIDVITRTIYTDAESVRHLGCLLDLSTRGNVNFFHQVDWEDAGRKVAAALKVLDDKVALQKAA